jgi:hypothetical protein
VIDVDYNVKMGYWASKNNVQEYKVFMTMIWMFNLDFVNNLQQALGDNLCGQPNQQTTTIVLTRLLRQK